MITLVLTIATMTIFGAHAVNNDKQAESVTVKQTTTIAYDSPKVDYSLIKNK